MFRYRDSFQEIRGYGKWSLKKYHKMAQLIKKEMRTRGGEEKEEEEKEKEEEEEEEEEKKGKEEENEEEKKDCNSYLVDRCGYSSL